MSKKLKYDFELVGDFANKIMVAIHGWQGNRESMKPLVNSLNQANVGWYFLEAPYEITNDSNKFSWSYEISKGVWEEEEPRFLLNDFFKSLFDKYTSTNIFVMGFSQGGLICLDYIAFLSQPLGGIFSIAGFSRNPKKQIPRFHICQKNTPFLLAHGKNDEKVPVSASLHIYDQLIDQGANAELLLYNGKHKIGIECLRKIKKIIQN
ncbi:MAG: prolyl oligopeptidase family serine peptidase [Candidatus Neomarinimicrobiota bacterium]|nr:prolyl oligopeptidase family serine peptidase [Candidatus Neomarinimicrobiota bacterium]|tara:strand:+ start:402 stop:1022 length:621 start_codon:yes stop_codon:yes gene_type:complete